MESTTTTITLDDATFYEEVWRRYVQRLLVEQNHDGKISLMSSPLTQTLFNLCRYQWSVPRIASRLREDTGREARPIENVMVNADALREGQAISDTNQEFGIPEKDRPMCPLPFGDNVFSLEARVIRCLNESGLTAKVPEFQRRLHDDCGSYHEACDLMLEYVRGF